MWNIEDHRRYAEHARDVLRRMSAAEWAEIEAPGQVVQPGGGAASVQQLPFALATVLAQVPGDVSNPPRLIVQQVDAGGAVVGGPISAIVRQRLWENPLFWPVRTVPDVAAGATVQICTIYGRWELVGVVTQGDQC